MTNKAVGLEANMSGADAPAPNEPAQLYLDLLKRTLSNWIYGDIEMMPAVAQKSYKRWVLDWLESKGIQAMRPRPFNPEQRKIGRDLSLGAHTMIGTARLNNLQYCVETAIKDGVPGDLIETGVWRGGACIFMRGILKAHGVTDRTVYVADSFEGLPPPDEDKYPADKGDKFHTYEYLAISLEEVQRNFTRYGLLDDQVKFLKGWFKDTLPTAPMDKIAVARLDGDMYESTMDALTHLYPKVSPGGFVIIDDYVAFPSCKKAVHDFRTANGIDDEIHEIDWTGVYWRRS